MEEPPSIIDAELSDDGENNEINDGSFDQFIIKSNLNFSQAGGIEDELLSFDTWRVRELLIEYIDSTIKTIYENHTDEMNQIFCEDNLFADVIDKYKGDI